MADRNQDERSYRDSYYGRTYDWDDEYGRPSDGNYDSGKRNRYGRSTQDYNYGSQGYGSGYVRSYGAGAQGRSRGEDRNYEYWSRRYGDSDYSSQGRSGSFDRDYNYYGPRDFNSRTFERDIDYGSRDYGNRYGNISDRYNDTLQGNYGERSGRGFGNEGRDFGEPITWTYTEIWWTPGPQTGQGPRGYQRSDERVLEDVNDRLTQHGQIDASNIEAKVKNCEVTLTGTVNTRQEKRMAEDTAESVWGVKDVHNQIRVKREQTDQQNQQDQQNRQKQQTQERAAQTP